MNSRRTAAKPRPNGVSRAALLTLLALCAALGLYEAADYQSETRAEVAALARASLTPGTAAAAAAEVAPVPATVPRAGPPLASVTAGRSAAAANEEVETHLGRKQEQAQTPSWKADKTRAISKIVSARVARIEKELSELERSGDSEGANTHRVLLRRLQRQLSTMNNEIAGYATAEAPPAQ